MGKKKKSSEDTNRYEAPTVEAEKRVKASSLAIRPFLHLMQSCCCCCCAETGSASEEYETSFAIRFGPASRKKERKRRTVRDPVIYSDYGK